MGADRSVLWFGVTRSESYDELGSALDKLADRFKRLGTSDDLIGWYTDTCCNGFFFLESSFINHCMQRRPVLARKPPQGP